MEPTGLTGCNEKICPQPMETHTSHSILFPKVQVPPTRLHLVSRKRLLQVLNAGLHRKLTLISAPAGYGKSTLLGEWATQCEWPLGWVTFEAGDNDIERFLTYLIAAVETAGAGTTGLSGMLGAGFSPQPLSMDVMLAILVNQLPTTVERLVIVLDDYHHIDNPDIHHFISSLLDHLPPNIHLIISTRSDPPLRLARLRAKDQLNLVAANDLRFTLDEARTFFEDVMQLRLTPDQVASLETRTEGWVTGLQLAALSMKELEHPAQLIETLTGTHHYILEYLLQEVFYDLAPLLQAFLLRVSILDRLSPALCDAVVGDLDLSVEPGIPQMPKEILEFMDAANLFVVPLDHQHQWYRFHPLFADFLRDRLTAEQGELLPELHHRAARWYAEHGLLSEAVGHSLAGGDVEGAADLVQAQAKDLLTRGEITTLYRWTTTLPEQTIQARPRLGLARAWAMLMRNPFDFWARIDQHIHQIAAGFGIAPQDLLGALAESEPGSERRSALGEFAMLQAFARREIMEIPGTIRLFKAALEYLPENERMLRGFTLAGLGSTYARTGAIEQAEEAFAQAAQNSLAAGSIFGYIASSDWQATMQAEQGQLMRAVQTFRQTIEKLSSHGQHALPLSGHVYVSLASVLLEQNDLAGSLENVQIGLRVGDQVKDIDALLTGYVVQARTLLALNRRGEADEAIQKAEQQALDTNSLDCIHDIQAQKALLALAAGDLEAAQRWAAARGIGQGELSTLEKPLAEIESTAYARLLMVGGQSSEALPILNQLMGAQDKMGRMRALIENLALQSLGCRALGRTDEAIRTLARALLLAEPEGFVRVFIEQGPPMAALLRAAASQGHSPEYARRLLAAFGENPSEQPAPLEALSERELEVLRLVADGLTNNDIARELVIAQSTVKTHINRIYGKLGVRTRTQAVARARQLQILH